MAQQSTEQKILEAAEKEFLTRGFNAARTTAIAKEAGVTHAMLHYYFRSKENLFEKIISNKMSSLGELMLGSIAESDLPLFDKISAAVVNHLDFISANPLLPQFFIIEIYSSRERMKFMAEALQASARQTLARLQRDIDEAARRGECRPVNAGMLMLDIVSLNVFSFLVQPVVEKVLPDLFNDRERFIEMRKQENVETIMRKLRI
ncbi:MAG: TetR/AcrR family transcriptional regulator [Bacteroides sp.]|nr:TetR/AcrR family transcriptional regulator [Bacteroides sp.]